MTTPENPVKTKSKRWIAILAILFFPLLVGLFYLEEDIMGKSDWSKFKRAQEADGEKFAFSDFVPPPVPDDQNFAMGPLLRLAFDYVHTTNGLKWRDSNAWQHVMSISPGPTSGSGNWLGLCDPEQGTLADLKIAAGFFPANTNFPQSIAPQNNAEVVLTALNKFAPDLLELQKAAAARPSARFPLEYSYEPSTAILLPHLAVIKGIVLVCELRAVAELETHRSTDAFADLQLAFRLSDSIRDEPICIDHLVRIATLEIAIQGIREGIARHAWSESQLLDFEKYLVKLDLLHEYEHVMRGERAVEISSVDYYRRQGFTPSVLSDGSSENSAFNWAPSGWFYRNERLIGEMYQGYLLPAIDESDRFVSPGLIGQMNRDMSKRPPGPYNFFAKMNVSGLAKAPLRPARGQTWIDQARVACALERYRMEHHDLPDTLDALTPQFIEKIPNDLLVNQPLPYHKNTNGAYVLFSFGWNRVDDGGVAGLRSGNTPQTDLTKGDWIWTFPVK